MPAFNISEAYNLLKPLGTALLALVIYSIFVFKFYRSLASRDIIKVNLSRYNSFGLRFVRLITYLLQNIFLFPLIVFFWFAVLAIFLGFLGKNQTTESILFISIALVSAVRVTAYYSEDLSRDLAKMLPFALLGIYLVDQSYFEFAVSLELLKGSPQYWRFLVYYLAFIVALEFVLRILYSIVSSLKGKQEHHPVMRESRKA